ncbi:nucleoside triphosphate pyrophosphatase [Mycobacterium sp.]|uniref:Maf family protein n=1 Tax=Mycobacterium sp. TaxID=1785 RepID=UPI0031DE0EAE
MTRLVLASASPGRLRVLRRAGVDPLVVNSGVDEDAVMARLGPDASPSTVVCTLAAAKADAVAQRLPADVGADCVVIGCDSMLEVDGRLVGKPRSADAARRQWHAMGGRAGTLHTGHCLMRLHNGEAVQQDVESACTTIYFGVPSTPELAAYVDSGEPLSVAGGFTIDGRGGWFVDRIDGDPSNVIGLSLPLTRRLLGRAGLSVDGLWSKPPTVT